jgi:4-hydroxybenzoyl-CoA thioesterase
MYRCGTVAGKYMVLKRRRRHPIPDSPSRYRGHRGWITLATPNKPQQRGRLMLEEKFTPPSGAFTRSVPIRFSHCDPAGIVYFPHYFDMFNGVIEDWYKDELKHDYAALVMGERFGFPFVHIECDFKIPSLMGDVIELTLLADRIGRSSLGIVIVCHRDGLLRLRARMVTAMMSLETRKPVPLPAPLRAAIEAYRARTAGG